MFKHNAIAAILLTTAISVLSPAHAQVERSGGGGATQKMMQQYQQLAAEKASLQQQLTQVKSDLDSAQTELAAVKKERDAAKAHPPVSHVSEAQLAQANAAKEAAEKSLEQYKQRMNELVTRFREMAGNLKDVESNRTQLKSDLDARNIAFDKCVADNYQLYEINGEILDRYAKIGPFTKISSVEPFTRL